MNSPISFVVAVSFVSLVACQTSSPTEKLTDDGEYQVAVEKSTTNVAEVGEIKSACPADMVLVDGEYCPKVEEKCLYNVDINGKRMPGKANDLWSCGEFQYPTRCLSDKKIHMRFCIDRYEYSTREDKVPQDWMTWYGAKKVAASLGKRLCTAKEWTLAAEGPEIHPLPYGDGYHRDSKACNIDRHFTDFPGVHIDVFQARRPDDEMSQRLRAFLVPSDSMPNCKSDYGVYMMAGNIDELVNNEGGVETCPNGGRCGNYVSGLKGGHFWHVRQAARPQTTAHGPTFGWYETGARGFA